jgi:hypothetical protein
MDVMIHRSKVKVIKMLLVVVVSFALSWLPLYVLVTRIKFGGPFCSEREEAMIHSLLPIAQWLGASNSCINPVLYAFFNKKFRVGFKSILDSRSCCKPLRYNNELSASVRSNLSCRVNTKNGSAFVTRMTVARPRSIKSKPHASSGNVQRHNSTSAAAVMRMNKSNDNYINRYARTCTIPSSETEKSHHIIKPSSVSALSAMNATSV